MVGAEIAVSSSHVPLADILDVESSTTAPAGDLEIQCVRLSRELEVLFVSAEVCSPYVGRRESAGVHRICVGYSGDVFGYLPSEPQALEGGYEARNWFATFGTRGRMRPGFQGRVEEAMRLASEEAAQGVAGGR